MKYIFFMGLLLSTGLLGSEHEVRMLLDRQNNQTIGLICAMATIGIHGLIQNSETVCSADQPYCWKVVAPLVALPLLGGCLLYKKVRMVKQ